MNHQHARNPGMEFDVAWVESVQVNAPAVQHRAETHFKRRSIKKTWQLAWLCRAVSCLDLTTLQGNDTASNVQRLCGKAMHPIRPDLVQKMNLEGKKITVASVCVYPNRVVDAVACLKGSGVPVASVAAGFPAGQTPMAQRVAEIRSAVSAGAGEIDIVISREHVIMHNWRALYDEIRAFREACGDAHLKTILATGELPTLRDVYKASLVCMMGGADFIKTSTGKEPVNATLPVSLVMIRAIRDYYERTGHKVGFKPAGGMRQAKEALAWLALMMEELGPDWTRPDLFRFGVSSMLIDLERQLEHGITGKYSSEHYMGMG